MTGAEEVEPSCIAIWSVKRGMRMAVIRRSLTNARFQLHECINVVCSIIDLTIRSTSRAWSNSIRHEAIQPFFQLPRSLGTRVRVFDAAGTALENGHAF